MCRRGYLKMTYGPGCPVNSWLSLTDYQTSWAAIWITKRQVFTALRCYQSDGSFCLQWLCFVTSTIHLHTSNWNWDNRPIWSMRNLCHMTVQRIIANVEPGCFSWTALFSMTLPFCTWLKRQKTVLNSLSSPFFCRYLLYYANLEV